MNAGRRALLTALTVALLIGAATDTARGFATLGSTWVSGAVTMHLQLTGGSGLSDGSANFNAVATAALSTWNSHLDRIQFAAVPASSVPRGDGDLLNHVFFDSNFYGESFGSDTLAITTRWTRGGSERVEADVVFNTRFQWDSYRGSVRSAWDIRRVALHEFGHVFGLDHPDEHGENKQALMNSILGNLDSLTEDDIAGARSLYGGAGVTGNISFPPRNEPADFFNQLIALYRDVLRAAASSTFVDPEGAVIWLTEYARQRVGQCTHEIATQNTLNQITGSASTFVCATTPAGPIPFPPRNEGLLFMNQLDATYRDTLRRSQGSSFVDNEGAVVWVLEYLRYRLNGCNHGDAVTRVFAQIRGQGIQPVCSA